ncbi:hypothetical protein PR048_009068 [Dryococelus australis]|uniref:Uncharacterized protein n=1 Tax=Dryococelus australis TaxID=614101 RepID=A0ABQ9HZR5_9NEOP|nr:hypothetical protein PR048_009068 [Dryococelus australis]
MNSFDALHLIRTQLHAVDLLCEYNTINKCFLPQEFARRLRPSVGTSSAISPLAQAIEHANTLQRSKQGSSTSSVVPEPNSATLTTSCLDFGHRISDHRVVASLTDEEKYQWLKNSWVPSLDFKFPMNAEGKEKKKILSKELVRYVRMADLQQKGDQYLWGKHCLHNFLQELDRLNLDISYFCGQAYDGGSNVSGKFKGIQAPEEAMRFHYFMLYSRLSSLSLWWFWLRFCGLTLALARKLQAEYMDVLEEMKLVEATLAIEDCYRTVVYLLFMDFIINLLSSRLPKLELQRVGQIQKLLSPEFSDGFEDKVPIGAESHRDDLSLERSFSTLRCVKTYLRSTITEDRLNGLAFLHIHQDIAFAMQPEEVLDIFARKQKKTFVKLLLKQI